MKNKLIYIALAAALIVCTVTGCTAQTANKETGTVTDSVSEKAKRSQTVIQYLPSLQKAYQKKIIRNQMKKTSQSRKKKQQPQKIQLQTALRTQKQRTVIPVRQLKNLHLQKRQQLKKQLPQKSKPQPKRLLQLKNFGIVK